MKLFTYEHCPFCVRARMIFGLKSIPFELAVIMEGDVETPTRMVGRKVVPILQKEDGSFMPESMDIVHYVDSLKSPLVADQPINESIEAWCKVASGIVSKLVVPRFTEGEFAELATQPARQAFRQREEKAFGDLNALLAETPTLINDVEQKLVELETLLPTDKTISTTDFILFPILRSLTIVKGIQYGPRVSEYLHRVAAAAQIDLLATQAR